MGLPVNYAKLDNITLDTMKFQDLVDEGRKRIRQYCPDWTEYNLSDPGITLLELFAWMTELTVYRLNQVPEKQYIKFLEMLGVNLEPAKPATADLTFRLAAPFPIDPRNPNENLYAIVPKGREFSARGGAAEPIIYTTDEELTILTARLKFVKHSESDTYALSKNQLQDEKKLNQPFHVFGTQQPALNASLYLGLDVTPPNLLQLSDSEQSHLAGHVLRITLRCKVDKPNADSSEISSDQSSGFNPTAPPVRWEVCTRDVTDLRDESAWQELEVGKDGDERDTTRGFTAKQGSVTLYLPSTLIACKLRHEEKAVWIRCRHIKDEANAENRYSVSPVIEQIALQTIGATTKATNCRIMGNEFLGTSNGEAAQTFTLKHKPIVLTKNKDSGKKTSDNPAFNRVVVENNQSHTNSKEERYTHCDTFAYSDKHDKHILINPTTGEVHFGPNIRQPDGTLHQYGKVPPVGSRIYIEGYQAHSGSIGNVPAHHIRVIHQSVPYVDSVTNRHPVENGRDAETVEEAILRAQRMMRAQQRAVSATDFETIVMQQFGAKPIRSAMEHPRYKEKARTTQFVEGEIVRVKCLSADDYGQPSNAFASARSTGVASGTAELLLVLALKKPNDSNSWHQWQLSTLRLNNGNLNSDEIKKYLQQQSLIATAVKIRHPALRAIKVTLSLEPNWQPDSRRDERLISQIKRFLYRYFSPLPYGESQNETTDDLPSLVKDQQWQGWSFGEPLDERRLRGLLYEIEGIRYINSLSIAYVDLDGKLQLSANALKVFDRNKNLPVLPLLPDQLLCSLEHEVQVGRS